jgi:hypothetical protein
MLQDGLNDLATCCIEQDTLDKIDLDIILNELSSTNMQTNCFS